MFWKCYGTALLRGIPFGDVHLLRDFEKSTFQADPFKDKLKKIWRGTSSLI